MKNQNIIIDQLKDIATGKLGWDIHQQETEILNQLSASKRLYVRIRFFEESIIASYDPDLTNQRLEKYQLIEYLFKNTRIGIPRRLHVELQKNIVFWEDCGDHSLQKFLTDSPTVGMRFKEWLRSTGNDAIKMMMSMDYDRNLPFFSLPKFMFEWEYHVLNKLIEVGTDWKPLPSFWEQMIEEYLKYVFGVLQRPYCVMHRDLQSSNILIKNRQLYLIDFQDLYWGPVLYDMISLVFDSYLDLSMDERFELLEFEFAYFNNELAKKSREVTWEYVLFLIFQRKLHDAGAFVAAAHDSGKTEFFKYIYPAVEMAYHAAIRLKSDLLMTLAEEIISHLKKE